MNLVRATPECSLQRRPEGGVMSGLSGSCCYGAVLVAIACGAFAVRLPHLAARPMHGDEGNQAVRTGMLLETGRYDYDPEDHHGPSLCLITAAALKLCGISRLADSCEFDYRIVPVVFGVGLILLTALVADGLGRWATVGAALLMAISPAMVYYSRYYIQETLLVFFTLATIVVAWRYVRSHSTWWAIACGACVGLMHATKETWILAAAAMVAGLVLALAWSRWCDGCLPSVRTCVTTRSLGLAVFAALLVAGLVYSSFGGHWRGIIDSVLAYSAYFRRGSEGGIHSHPWYYYLQLLAVNRPARGFFWSEGLIIGLAAVGGMTALTSSSRPGSERSLLRFLVFFTLVLTGFYSAVPYKTPWCLLSFWTGMVLLAGVGMSAIITWTPTSVGKGIAIALLIAGAVQLGWQSYLLNFRFAADPRNPYVYAHTSPDLVNLAAQLERLSQVSARGRAMAIHVVTAENYWPLPWYLRKSEPNSVGYWNAPASWSRDVANLPPPDVIVTTPEEEAAIDVRVRAAYNRQMLYGLRPGVLLRVYVREELWRAFLKAQETQGHQGTTAHGEPAP